MSVRGSLEALIRDKASIIFIALYLLYTVLEEPTETLFDMIRLTLMVILVLGILYENHRHVEKTGNYEKGTDIITELKDWILKEVNRAGTKNEERDSPSESRADKNTDGSLHRGSESTSSKYPPYCEHGIPLGTRCDKCETE